MKEDNTIKAQLNLLTQRISHADLNIEIVITYLTRRTRGVTDPRFADGFYEVGSYERHAPG